MNIICPQHTVSTTSHLLFSFSIPALPLRSSSSLYVLSTSSLSLRLPLSSCHHLSAVGRLLISPGNVGCWQSNRCLITVLIAGHTRTCMHTQVDSGKRWQKCNFSKFPEAPCQKRANKANVWAPLQKNN